tara:strand:+ start:42 stop:485 length:444 start_codon:yes stop_codon:yes gene_type:complete
MTELEKQACAILNEYADIDTILNEKKTSQFEIDGSTIGNLISADEKYRAVHIKMRDFIQKFVDQPTINQTTEKRNVMKTVYARVTPFGKILINDQMEGVKLSCSDDDFNTIYRLGYIDSIKQISFCGDVNIENGELTLNKSTDKSEF